MRPLEIIEYDILRLIADLEGDALLLLRSSHWWRQDSVRVVLRGDPLGWRFLLRRFGLVASRI